MPREGIYTCVFAPPPPLSDENPVMLHFFAYAEISFAHILVFHVCAIEVQHINETSPTVITEEPISLLLSTKIVTIKVGQGTGELSLV